MGTDEAPAMDIDMYRAVGRPVLRRKNIAGDLIIFPHRNYHGLFVRQLQILSVLRGNIILCDAGSSQMLCQLLFSFFT